MLWLCLVLSFCSIFESAKAEEGAPPSLINLTEQPIARVHGTVNVISGDWVDQEVHDHPSGPDSYAIGHSYSSSNENEGSLSDAWNFLWPSVLESDIVYGDDFTPNREKITLHEAGGAQLTFLTGSFISEQIEPLFVESGYNLISTIDHPATRDPSKIQIRFSKTKKAWVVTLPDGTKRIFTRRSIQDKHALFHDDQYGHIFYNLVKETLPSKNVRYFTYDKEGNLSDITTKSSCGQYLIQKISLKRSHDKLYAKSLDGREVVFELEKELHPKLKKHPDRFVKSISRSGATKRFYTYTDKKKNPHSRIEERSWSSGLVEEAKYYKGDDTKIDGKKVHVPKGDRDFTDRRVSEVRTKRFRGEKTFMKHGFFYDKKDSDGDYRILRAEDIDASAITYMWNPEKRIIWTSYYNKHNHKIGQEYFVWGEKKKNEGRLIQRTVYDEEKNPLLLRKWKFTKEGYAKEENWHGLFTRYNAPELSVSSKDRTKPEGGETITIHATWDEYGHQLSKTDALGNVVESEYDRCFVAARYHYHKHEQILSREFYKYDTAGCLIQSIQDDGCEKGEQNLAGVHRRTITRIQPRRSAPHFGEPDRITHLVWTPASKERLLSDEYFVRDAKGRVISERTVAFDGLERSITYKYDAIDRLIETSHPDGSFERIVYDETSGLVTEKSYPHKRLQYTYDLFNRVISEKELFSDGTFLETTTDYDMSGRMMTVRDSHGNKTIIEKDILGRIVSKTLPELTTASGRITPVEKRKYRGRSVIITSPTGAVTETVYSSFGNPLLIKHPEGYCSTFTYDLLGRLIESSDGTLINKTYYNQRGQIRRLETWANNTLIDWKENRYNGSDIVEVETELLLTKMDYDAFGQCITQRIIDKATKKEILQKTSYDGLGRILRTEKSDVIEEMVYDTMGRPIKITSHTTQGRLLMCSTKSYDLAGRVVESSIQQDQDRWLTTKTAYGAYGLPSSITAPDGSSTYFLYTFNATTWSKKTIDPRGVVSIETSMGTDAATSTTIMDPLGNVISSQRTFVNLLGLPERMEYDIYYQGQKEKTLVTLLSYDPFGRTVSLREAAGTSEEVRSTKSYDCYGRCVEETLPSGVRLSSTFDKKGRLVRKTSSDGSIDQAFSYTYHDCIAEAKDLINKTSTFRSYDAFKHIVSETQSNGLALRYTYDASGLLHSVHLPDNSSIEYSFSGGLLESATRTSSKGSYTFGITKRNDAGMVLETSLPLNGGLVQYTYDSMGHVLSKEQRKAPESRTYDIMGRVESRTISQVTEQYRYDLLSQLISDNGRERAYDSLYRLREKEGESTEVTLRQQVTKLGDKKFSYDLDGRRIYDCGAHLSYDALGRLCSYEKNGVTESYTYDAFARRMTKTVNGSTERYLWLGQQEIGTYNANQEAISFRLLAESVGSEGGASIVIELNGTPYVAYSDLSGNIRSLVSTDGEEVHTASYSAFSRLSTTGLDCPWGFFSKRHDTLSGYVMFLYRLYDPETSSWITQDPLGLEGGPNLYAYVKGNPLSRFDTLGLFDLGGMWDSCCGFVSDCCSTISDFCSSVGESISDTCGAISDYCSSIFGSDGGSSDPTSGCYSSTTAQAPLKNLEEQDLSLDPMKKLQKYLPGYTNFTPTAPTASKTSSEAPEAGLYIYPYGKLENFLEAAKQDPSLFNRLSPKTQTNGLGTKMQECQQRSPHFKDTNHNKDLVVIAYNPKHPFLIAVGKAIMNALGIQTKESTKLTQDWIRLCDHMIAAGVPPEFVLNGHSHGAAIDSCMLNSKEWQQFKTQTGIDPIQKIHTYGAATFISGATNHVAFFDFVPLLNPRNWLTALVDPGCIEFTPFTWQSPLKAHGFDNPSYHEAFMQANHF